MNTQHLPVREPGEDTDENGQQRPVDAGQEVEVAEDKAVTDGAGALVD